MLKTCLHQLIPQVIVVLIPLQANLISQVITEPSELASTSSHGHGFDVKITYSKYLRVISLHAASSRPAVKASSDLRHGNFLHSPSKPFGLYFSLLFIHHQDQLVGAEFVRVITYPCRRVASIIASVRKLPERLPTTAMRLHVPLRATGHSSA